MSIVLKSWNLNLLESSGPVQACNGIFFYTNWGRGTLTIIGNRTENSTCDTTNTKEEHCLLYCQVWSVSYLSTSFKHELLFLCKSETDGRVHLSWLLGKLLPCGITCFLLGGKYRTIMLVRQREMKPCVPPPSLAQNSVKRIIIKCYNCSFHLRRCCYLM
jgi:hypothetical protein